MYSGICQGIPWRACISPVWLGRCDTLSLCVLRCLCAGWCQGIGTVEINDGSTTYGFICEAYVSDLTNSADDITDYGSWLNYIAKHM